MFHGFYDDGSLSSVIGRVHHLQWIAFESDYYRKGGGKYVEATLYATEKLDRVLSLLFERMCTMNGRKNKGFVPNIKFVELELTTEQKSGFKEWNWADEDSLSSLNTMGEDGFKFGTRYDKSNGSWIVSITCAEPTHKNYGYCLSARGRSFLHALAIALYKHHILLREDWTSTLPDDENDGGWG